MISNQARTVRVIKECENLLEESTPENVAQALADTNLLMPDNFTREYGVWAQGPGGGDPETYWKKSFKDARVSVKSLKASGWQAEVVSRFVSVPHFIALMEMPDDI